MPQVSYKPFVLLWEKVEKRYATENSQPFDLVQLQKHLNASGIDLNQNEIKNIENKFYNNFKLRLKQEDVNLSNSVYTKLLAYAKVKNFGELLGNINVDEIVSQIEKEVDNKYSTGNESLSIGFLGRENELQLLEAFLKDDDKKIFGLYGIPMIGKTWLVEKFLNSCALINRYDVIIVKLNPLPEMPTKKIKETIFGARAIDDFSEFNKPTLIVVQNFEEALQWKGDETELHDIQEDYKIVKTIIQNIINQGNIKMIIESRFQINKSFITPQNAVQVLPNIQLKGVEREKFWIYYKSKKFSWDEFEKLCTNFNNHTGLLALAYNDADWLYENDLTQALHQPKVVTKRLWEFIEYIISKLESQEVWILCALTYLQKPISEAEFNQIISYLPDFGSIKDLDSYLFSLKKKLLTQTQKETYELNPYLREVCFTFLKERKGKHMKELAQIPFIQKQGATPQYDPVRQAIERGDYMFLFEEGKDYIKKRMYQKALEYLEACLQIDPKKKYVLNELGIAHKLQKNHEVAIDYFNKAAKFGNIHSKNELAICYKEKGKYDEALSLLLELVNVDKHLPAFNELAIFYKEKSDYKNAIGVLNKALKIKQDDVKTLNMLAICLRDIEKYEEAIDHAELAIKLGSNQTYFVLVTILEKTGDIEKALKMAEKGINTPGWNKENLIFKKRELEKKANRKSNKINVFLSYSHKDEELKEALDNHLSALKRNGQIAVWNNRKIVGGQEWSEEIKQELNSAHIVLMLISADFIASDRIWTTEIKKAIERHYQKKATIIPIYCRPCDFKDMPFEKIQGLPKDAKPITSFAEIDTPLSEIAISIRSIVDTMSKNYR